MLRGDLATTPLEQVLRVLAAEERTGCLRVEDPQGEEALVYLKAGEVYAVTMPSRRPALGVRLISSGALAPDALAEALEAQRSELQGWRLGELLVHLGYVDQEVVEAFVQEQVRDAAADLARWRAGRFRLRLGERTREDVAAPIAVPALLDAVRERHRTWETLLDMLHGPTAVPVLSAGDGGLNEFALDPDSWALLCKVDGERSIAELGRACGFTLFETGQVVYTLVQAGLLEVEPPAGGTPHRPGSAHGVPQPREEPPVAPAPADEPVPGGSSVVDAEDDPFGASIARVSQALSNVLGPRPSDVDAFGEQQRLTSFRNRAVPEPVPAPAVDPQEMLRHERVRAAASAELAATHAAAEEERQAHEQREAADPPIAAVIELARFRDLGQGDGDDAVGPASSAPTAVAASTAGPDVAIPAAAPAIVSAPDVVPDAESASDVSPEVDRQLGAGCESELPPVTASRHEPGEPEAASHEPGEPASAKPAPAAPDATDPAAAEPAPEAAEPDISGPEPDQPDLPESLALSDAAEEATARSRAAALLAELSESPVTPDRSPAGHEEHRALGSDAAHPVGASEPDDPTPPTPYPRADTDTASLLRELSSLGLEDPPPVAPPPARPAPPPPPPPKRRKSLFGR